VTCHTRWIFRPGRAGCGTRMHTIPGPLGHIDRRRISDHLQRLPGHLSRGDAGHLRPGRLPTAVLPGLAGHSWPHPSCLMRNGEAAGGRHRGKPNLIGVHAATIPSPHDRHRCQPSYRARRPRETTATRAAHPSPCRTGPPRAPHLRRSGWTPGPAARHPGDAPRPHGDAGSTLAKPEGRGAPATQAQPRPQPVSWPPHATIARGQTRRET